MTQLWTPPTPKLWSPDISVTDREIRELTKIGRGVKVGRGVKIGSTNPTPLTIIKSVPVLQWIRGDLGITLATGVSAWADQSGNAHHFTQATGGAQPLYTAADATLNNRPSITADGVNDTLLNSTMPNGDGNWVSGIVKVVTWTTNRCLWGSNAAPETGDLLTYIGTPSLALYNGTGAVIVNAGLPVNTWGRAEMYGVNTAAGYLKLRSTTVAGAVGGSTTSTGCALFSTIGIAFGNDAIAERVVCSGKPTANEISELEAYYVRLYTQANVA